MKRTSSKMIWEQAIDALSAKDLQTFIELIPSCIYDEKFECFPLLRKIIHWGVNDDFIKQAFRLLMESLSQSCAKSDIEAAFHKYNEEVGGTGTEVEEFNELYNVVFRRAPSPRV